MAKKEKPIYGFIEKTKNSHENKNHIIGIDFIDNTLHFQNHKNNKDLNLFANLKTIGCKERPPCDCFNYFYVNDLVKKESLITFYGYPNDSIEKQLFNLYIQIDSLDALINCINPKTRKLLNMWDAAKFIKDYPLVLFHLSYQLDQKIIYNSITKRKDIIEIFKKINEERLKNNRFDLNSKIYVPRNKNCGFREILQTISNRFQQRLTEDSIDGPHQLILCYSNKTNKKIIVDEIYLMDESFDYGVRLALLKFFNNYSIISEPVVKYIKSSVYQEYLPQDQLNRADFKLLENYIFNFLTLELYLNKKENECIKLIPYSDKLEDKKSVICLLNKSNIIQNFCGIIPLNKNNHTLLDYVVNHVEIAYYHAKQMLKFIKFTDDHIARAVNTIRNFWDNCSDKSWLLK